MSVAFGIPQAPDGTGTTAQDMRRIIGALYPTPGVVRGLDVAGTTTLAYDVAAGVAVCSRGGSDGSALAWFPGGRTPAVGANASPSPRIDTVWICAHDRAQGDADNLVTIGVTQGAPSATPAAPKEPVGSVPVAFMMVPAGATTTASATRTGSVGSAIPYGASMGVLLDQSYTAYEALRSNPFTFASGDLYLTRRRIVEVDLTTSVWAYNPTTLNWLGSGYVDWSVDGRVMRAFRFLCYPGTVSCQTFTDVASLDAGHHTVSARLWASATPPASSLWLDYDASSWPGQRLVVTDVGVA